MFAIGHKEWLEYTSLASCSDCEVVDHGALRSLQQIEFSELVRQS